MNKLDYSKTSVTSCGRCNHTWNGSFAYAPAHDCKPRKKFSVTYEIVTPESAELGDADERGYIAENISFRDAVSELGATRTARVDGSSGVTADGCWPAVPRWLTLQNGMEYETGAYESRSLHIPASVTASSALRIARYLGAYTYTAGHVGRRTAYRAISADAYFSGKAPSNG